MDNFDQILGDLGVKQWVRNKFIGQLKEYNAEKKHSEDFVDQFNKDILRAFKKVANEAIDEIIEQLKTLDGKEE